jgi:hypothetical protein
MNGARWHSICRAGWTCQKLGAALWLFACGACGPRPPALQNPGASSVNIATAARAQQPVPTTSAHWEGMAALSGMQTAGPAFSSRGHFVDGRPATVLVNAAAAAPYLARHPEGRFPAGAVLVERLAAGRTERGALLAMIKRAPGSFEAGGDWEYLVAQSDGAVEDRGSLVLCARCHAEAPSDWVFGVP